MSTPPSITCPACGRTSYHPMDIRERYCGACHMYHADMRLSERAALPVLGNVLPDIEPRQSLTVTCPACGPIGVVRVPLASPGYWYRATCARCGSVASAVAPA